MITIKDILEIKFWIGFFIVILSFILPQYFFPFHMSWGVMAWEPELTYHKATMLALFLIGIGIMAADLIKEHQNENQGKTK